MLTCRRILLLANIIRSYKIAPKQVVYANCPRLKSCKFSAMKTMMCVKATVLVSYQSCCCYLLEMLLKYILLSANLDFQLNEEILFGYSAVAGISFVI